VSDTLRPRGPGPDAGDRPWPTAGLPVTPPPGSPPDPGTPGGPPAAPQPDPQARELDHRFRLLLLIGIVVGLGALFGWSILMVVAALVVSVFLHELGHYVVAKWCGMKVTEFFIGFGPRLWSFRRGETEYGLKAFPAGAYVKVIGMTNVEEVPPEDEARTYRQASYPRRMAVALAGSFMHFVQAFVILMIVYVAWGITSSGDWRVEGIVEGSAAAEAGMQPGDQPLSVDGQPIAEFSDLGDSLTDKADAPVTFTWDRDGETMSGTATVGSRLTEEGAEAIDGDGGLQARDRFSSVDGQPVSSYTEFAQAVQVGGTYSVSVLRGNSECSADVTVQSLPPVQGAASGFLGVQAEHPRQSVGVLSAAGHSVGDIGSISAQSVSGIARFMSPSNLAGFVSDSFEPRNTTSAECRVITDADERRALSIIGFGRLATDAGSDVGASAFLMMFAVFNIFLGLFNLLPLLPFDGGHVVIATYERIRSRNGQRYFVDVNKVMPVAYVVVMFMVVIGTLALFRDIYDPLQIGG
jgi:RIP metalloprotease RseP